MWRANMTLLQNITATSVQTSVILMRLVVGGVFLSPLEYRRQRPARVIVRSYGSYDSTLRTMK